MNQTDVLIAGAGPTGLTLACDLARRGVSARVIDKSPTDFPGSRAKGLMPRTLEVFDDLGVVGEVLASSGPFPPFRGYAGETVLWDRTIYQMAGFPELTPTPDLPYTTFRMIPQWRTEEILRARLVALGGRVERGTELTALNQDGEGVTASLVRDGRVEEVRCRYLVGADGGPSFVRKAIGIGFAGTTDATDRSIIADVIASGPDRDHWHTWTNPGNPANRVSLCPLPGTDFFQFVAPVTTDDVPALTLESLQAIFDQRSGVSGVRLSDLRWATMYRVNVRLADRFRMGRVFLAGDAAHVHSPAGGQGLNTGVQDAYNLGWKLGAVLRGAPETLLDSYEAERLPVAAHVLGMTSALHKRWANGGTPRSAADDVYQLRLSYQGGPLARDNGGGRVRAGDRAPDAPCRDAAGNLVRLFDAFRGPHFTLLAFERHDGRYGEPVRAYTVLHPGEPIGGPCLVDADGLVRSGYGVESGFVLVRPDGYIGLIAPDEAAVREYLALVMGGPAM
ncbi:FAD-dependent oxidoreductase [Fimbriiglobus ruber]|uniref:Putative monooxygenase n=1 Tax=Fimbriiglobus ruber TaxID=1908690 RepID=A0A225DK22_9BACT|nr:FAD-dependent oxidoreductase [Fimbriiglobus ruber]OWK37796.1 putative monooxygenase [Fimbriiglobus ruber]